MKTLLTLFTIVLFVAMQSCRVNGSRSSKVQDNDTKILELNCFVLYENGGETTPGPKFETVNNQDKIDHVFDEEENYTYKVDFLPTSKNGLAMSIRHKKTKAVLALFHGRVQLDEYQRLSYLNTTLVCTLAEKKG